MDENIDKIIDELHPLCTSCGERIDGHIYGNEYGEPLCYDCFWVCGEYDHY